MTGANSTGAVAAAPADAYGFAIKVPETWFEIDVNPATRGASINALVRARTRGVPRLAARRDEIAGVLRAAAREAAAAGALYCGVMVAPVEGTGLTASVTVSLLPGAAGDRRLDSSAAIAATFVEKVARSPDDPWTKVGTVELPSAGPAARVQGIEDVELPGAGSVRAALMRTFVPVPGTDKIVLISCSSPNLFLADALLDLFDAVTGTFRFVPRVAA